MDVGRNGLRRLRTDPLLLAACAFLLANAVHGLDHVRRGTGGLPAGVIAGGPVLTLTAVAVLWLAWRRHPRTPLVAAIVGILDGILIAQAHMAPNWGTFSDPFPGARVDALGWAIMLAEVASAFALGLAGLFELRRQSRGALDSVSA
jgi:hypothetical protein